MNISPKSAEEVTSETKKVDSDIINAVEKHRTNEYDPSEYDVKKQKESAGTGQSDSATKANTHVVNNQFVGNQFGNNNKQIIGNVRTLIINNN